MTAIDLYQGSAVRTLRTTKPIENLNGSIARFTRNVKREQHWQQEPKAA